MYCTYIESEYLTMTSYQTVQRRSGHRSAIKLPYTRHFSLNPTHINNISPCKKSLPGGGGLLNAPRSLRVQTKKEQTNKNRRSFHTRKVGFSLNAPEYLITTVSHIIPTYNAGVLRPFLPFFQKRPFVTPRESKMAAFRQRFFV